MQKTILLCLTIFPVLAFPKVSSFTIKGNAGSLNKPAKVYLDCVKDHQHVIDSSEIINGLFEFKGTVEFPIQGFIFLNKSGNGKANTSDYRDLYLENGTILITIQQDSMALATVEGTPSNEDNILFREMTKPSSDASAALMIKKENASPEQLKSESFIHEIDSLTDFYTKESISARKKFILEHPNSAVSLIQLNNLTYFKIDASELVKFYDKLLPQLKESALGKELAIKLANMQLLTNGMMAPDFSLPDINGKMVSLSSFRGKYVLIDFWASWCVPCRRENPNVVRAYQNYKGKNFTVLGVSLDSKNGKSQWAQAIQKDGINWTQVSDLKGFESKAALLYHISAIPQNYLIGPDGRILDWNLKGPNLQNKLKEILK